MAENAALARTSAQSRRRFIPAYSGAVPTPRLHRVAGLVLEGAKPLDVGIPAQVFTTRASMPYEVRVCGPAPGLVTGGDGLSYHVADGLDALAWADIVFVPGYRMPDHSSTVTVSPAVSVRRWMMAVSRART